MADNISATANSESWQWAYWNTMMSSVNVGSNPQSLPEPQMVNPPPLTSRGDTKSERSRTTYYKEYNQTRRKPTENLQERLSRIENRMEDILASIKEVQVKMESMLVLLASSNQSRSANEAGGEWRQGFTPYNYAYPQGHY